MIIWEAALITWHILCGISCGMLAAYLVAYLVQCTSSNWQFDGHIRLNVWLEYEDGLLLRIRPA
jgi:hypothetical protein